MTININHNYKKITVQNFLCNITGQNYIKCNNIKERKDQSLKYI